MNLFQTNVKKIFTLLLLLGSVFPAQAANETTFSDWRLERPVLHGLLSGMSFGLVTVGSTHWTVANKHDPSGYPQATIKYLEQHRRLPYAIGFTLGALSLSFLMFSLLFYFFRGRSMILRYKQVMS